MGLGLGVELRATFSSPPADIEFSAMIATREHLLHTRCDGGYKRY